jgi:hypothetical protein
MKTPKSISIDEEEISIKFPNRSLLFPKNRAGLTFENSLGYGVTLKTPDEKILIFPRQFENYPKLIKALESFIPTLEDTPSISTSSTRMIFSQRISYIFAFSVIMGLSLELFLLLIADMKPQQIATHLFLFSSMMLLFIFAIKHKKIEITDNSFTLISPFFRKEVPIKNISEVQITPNGIVTFILSNGDKISTINSAISYSSGFYSTLENFLTKHNINMRSIPLISSGISLYLYIFSSILSGIAFGMFLSIMISVPYFESVNSKAGITLGRGVFENCNGLLTFTCGTNSIVLDIPMKNFKHGVRGKIVAYLPKNLSISNEDKFLTFIYMIPLVFFYLVLIIPTSYYLLKSPPDNGQMILKYYSFVDRVRYSSENSSKSSKKEPPQEGVDTDNSPPVSKGSPSNPDQNIETENENPPVEEEDGSSNSQYW